MGLYDLWYPADSSDCANIVSHYSIARTHIGNKMEREGLQELSKAFTRYLEDLKEDLYYEERLKIEAITFLSHLICYQRHPVHSWWLYYKHVLSAFHELSHLEFKADINISKRFVNKRTAVIVTMLDAKPTTIHYKSQSELRDDFGRYRGDLIMRERVKSKSEKISFEAILGLIL